MKKITRRDLVKRTLAGSLLVGLHDPFTGSLRQARAAGPNSEVRLAILGLGGIDVEGSVGGRGRQLLKTIQGVAGTKVVALCDPDEKILHHGVQLLKDRGNRVAAHTDLRRVFDDKDIDAVVVATPNHWHALATIWACQSGKDVYVEKPFSHNIWEGRQMVAAARKHDRIVQTGMQSRSNPDFAKASEEIHSGQLGAIRCVHAIIYRARGGIGRVSAPTPVPASVDYNLWCGPIPMAPVMRKNFHYEWHWFWATGNGEIGNNGPHTIDVARWVLGQDGLPPRALSVGGRFGVDDDAETANTQVVILDYQPAPMICEVRNLEAPGKKIGKYHGTNRGVVVDLEGGYYVVDASGGTLYDNRWKQVKRTRSSVSPGDIETRHMENFIGAMRSRKMSDLNAEAEVGRVSAACCHIANVSHRLGKATSPSAVGHVAADHPELADALERCGQYLSDNGVNLDRSQPTVGPWVNWDSNQHQFTGEHADAANRLSHPVYRKPFEVPELA